MSTIRGYLVEKTHDAYKPILGWTLEFHHESIVVLAEHAQRVMSEFLYDERGAKVLLSGQVIPAVKYMTIEPDSGGWQLTVDFETGVDIDLQHTFEIETPAALKEGSYA